MPEVIELQDQTNDRRYFTILPNMLDDSELSPYAVRLYLRIKRRAGEDGKCWENSRHLAEGCRMSRSQVTRAKDELKQAGLIRIEKRAAGHGHFPGHLITTVDIWQANIEKYSPVPVVDTSCPSGNPRPVPGAHRDRLGHPGVGLCRHLAGHPAGHTGLLSWPVRRGRADPVPAERVDPAAGAEGVGRPLDDRDHRLAARIGPALRERGMLFVGLDVIGGFVTEINVTSPTGVREIDQQFGTDIAGSLMDAIGHRVDARGGRH